MNITLIGGDRRMAVVADLLSARASVRTLALAGAGAPAASGLFSALSGAEVVVFPLPATRDGLHPVVLPGAGQEVPTFREIFSRAEEETLLLGGSLPPALRTEAEQAGLSFLDYYESEVLLEKNAVATAEAAIAMAITESPAVLTGTAVAVIGYGRIGRAIARLAHAAGADVTVYARAPLARAQAEGIGCRAMPIGQPITVARDTRVVFHTAPAPLWQGDALSLLPRGCLLLDLAGHAVDTAAAEKRGICCPPALALPGRFSPESAGRYIFDEILHLIQTKRGVTL